MSTGDETIQPVGSDLARPGRFGVVAHRVLSAAQAFAFRELAPVLIAVVCVLIIAVAPLAVAAHHRIIEIAQQRAATGAAPPADAPTNALAPQAFTLAPEEVRALTPDDARAFNARIAFSTLPILAARPFIMAPDNIQDYSRALDCLATAIYYEAASETPEGQAAVAQVVLNRMRHPAYPNTVCGVVFQGSERVTGCQFSFTCDGAMARTPSVDGWARARAVAGAALNGQVATGVGMATHYHTDWVAPYWAERLVKMRQIGTHIFYRWSGSWGLPFAFNRQHTGAEPVILKMAALSTLVETPPEPVAPELLDLPAPDLIAEALQAEPLPVAPVAPPVAAPVQALAVAPAQPAPPTAMANPLASPVTAPPRRRSRIATPRGW